MDILIQLGLIALGLAILTKGADLFVKGSVNLAVRLGISASVVGATVVAFGTSAPELITSIMAAAQGQIEIALGNVIGSNICNIGVAVGATAVVKPMRADPEITRWDGPFLIGSALLLALVVWFWPAQGETGEVLAIGIPEGIALLAGMLLFTLANVIRGLRSRGSDTSEEVVQARLEVQSKPVWRDIVFFTIGLGALLLGSAWLVQGASTLADLAGIDPFVVGCTVVAVGTSLPEILTSFIAAMKGESDLAIANVTGSNVQNILLTLGVSTLFASTGYLGVDYLVARDDLTIMLGFTLLLMLFMLWRREVTRARGALLATLYVGYIAFLLIRGPTDAA